MGHYVIERLHIYQMLLGAKRNTKRQNKSRTVALEVVLLPHTTLPSHHYSEMIHNEE